jgi:2-polyprenyl-3-methyl-5-hydroxy-6-metoxy-1,4-benzoquinol methylase
MSGASTMRTQPRPDCYLCRSAGVSRYENLPDRLFGAAGRWNLRACSNAACGLLWLDPMPIAEDIGKAYADYYTHEQAPDRSAHPLYPFYAAMKDGYISSRYGYLPGLPIWKRLAGRLMLLFPARRVGVDFSVMWLGALPGGRLLDVGCGSGWLLDSMRRLGWTAEGVDVDAKAVEQVRARGHRVHYGFLPDLKLPAESYDAIAMSHFIEHVHDPVSVVAKCRQLLKEGGRLVIVTPNTRSLSHRLYGKDWRGLEPPRHLHLFNLGALGEVVRRGGFRRIQAWTSPREARGIFLASRSIRRSGHCAKGAPESALLRWWALGAQFCEWLALKVNGDLGEEIVLVAEK